MAKGMFPDMSIPDIVNAFSTWGIAVSAEQLKNPTSDFVEGVYCACLERVSGIGLDVLREPVQNTIDNSAAEDKDLFSSAMSFNIMLYHLSRFARAAKVDDFSSQDLYQPDRARTLKLLSAFINFVKFAEQYCDPFLNELRERSDSLVVQRATIGEQIQEVQDKIDEIRGRIEKDKPILEKLNAESTALTNTMFATKDAQAKAVRDVEQHKSERNALQKRKEILNGELKTIEDSVSRAKSRIVQSPERIRKTISVMSTSAMEDKRQVAMQEAKARDLQVKINALHNIETDVRGCIEQIQTIDREVESLEVSQKALGQLRDLLDAKAIERNELQIRQERLNDQLSHALLKLERAHKHADDKKLASQNTIERLQQEYDNMVVERRENDKQIEEVRGEANEVERKIQDHLRQSEAELNELLTEYWKIRHQTDVFMETLANTLNMKVTTE